MDKAEAEIQKLIAETDEIKRRSTGWYTHPLVKLLISGLVAGVVFFAAWLGVYKEILFKKNLVAQEEIRLSRLENERIKIVNDINLIASKSERDSIIEDYKRIVTENELLAQQIKSLNENLSQTKDQSQALNQKLLLTEQRNERIKSRIKELDFAGSQWSLTADGYPNTITLLQDGRISGFGKFNDYWEFRGDTLVLLTGADRGKNSWTRIWYGTQMTDKYVSGIVENRTNETENWKMERKE
ncbi:MAG: hypothetical protein ABJF04_18510 [Reichenbachiella sp.]|uniref:hypothetical protein n=1 Tax=Reichenbachiella sp. TaxID=2184521 RepID=UPI003266AEE9